MYSKFPLFQSHIDLAHRYWKELVIAGDTIIDATCGNGHDTLLLSQHVGHKGSVWGLDIQQDALDKTRCLLEQNLSPEHMQKIILRKHSHARFPEEIQENSIKLIVYNLGYLPGGSKSLTTRAETTLSSLEHAQKLILPGGAISITCYPGHPEGKNEEEAILTHTSTWPPQIWNCLHHRSLNRLQAPSLLFLQRAMD
jgi:SAM-dependent methyltransferase